MAKVPLSTAELIERHGPHLANQPPGGWAHRQPDRLVKTHCCFCGMQCGIQLKVKDDQVIGFEPWEEFPVNHGMLCPKGVKRYLQGSHPDRLLAPLVRTSDGFRAVDWQQAMDLVTEKIRHIQEKYGRDAMAVLGGASLTNEKAYLVGKLARLALKTRNVDYNGRLCMDRGGVPWSELPQARCVMLVGTNVGECFPILTDYIWRARDNGAKIIVVDPRATPIGRTADLLLPLRPGRDSALMNGLLHVCLKRGYVDRRFVEEHTVGYEAVENLVAAYTPARTAEITGVPAAAIERAAE